MGDPASIRLITQLSDQAFQQRYNVAASRARDQMWVVYSLDPAVDLKSEDLRRRLIEHALDPMNRSRKVERAERRVDSKFERQVLRRLHARGYRVRPQWEVGHYRIDLVVEGGRRRLAVECDGDRFHTIDNLQDDLARQATLERLGWKFARIRGTHFFQNPDAAMAPVFDALDALEIPPGLDDTRAALGLPIARHLARRWKDPKGSSSVQLNPRVNSELCG